MIEIVPLFDVVDLTNKFFMMCGIAVLLSGIVVWLLARD